MWLQEMLFGDYRVQSRSQNRVAIQMNMKNLLNAFSSGSAQALAITLRLTKVGLVPYLTVDILVSFWGC